MGQVTLPVLNRKGIYSLWEHNWENKNHYSQNINEDMFLKKFFKYFLKSWLSTKKTNVKYLSPITSQKKKMKIKKFLNFKISKNEIKNDLSKLPQFRQFPYYFSRIYLIKYANWVIIYMYIYIPDSWVNKFNKYNKKIFNVKYSYDLFSYHNTKTKYFNK